MEQEKSSVGTVVLAVIITAVVVGGGVYLWQQKSSKSTTKAVTEPTATTPVKKELTERRPTPTAGIFASVLKVVGLSFTLPKGWVLDKIDIKNDSRGSWEVAKIKVPDPKYNVTLPMEILKNDATYKIDQGAELLKTTVSGAKIYNNGCGAVVCYDLLYRGNIYSINFAHVDSDQPVPANAGELWFPDTTVTVNDTLNFLATVQLKSN